MQMKESPPLLRFGVASDLHVTDWASAETFRRALRWFRDQGVDAVTVPGDLTDHGILPQLENVARSWREVFPDDRAPDGRRVERLFIYGNHDFEGVKYVDVTGVTKGRGFAGVLKRYNFAGGNMTHGGHSKRRTGGLAARDLPGWIEKGKKMPGHMGDVSRKAVNLEVVQIRPEDNAILVKGSVPGARNGTVYVRKSLKNNVLAFKAKKGAK